MTSENKNEVLSTFEQIKKESEDAAFAEYNNLDSISSGKIRKPKRRGLIAKLNADPSQAFKVSEYSCYKDNRWILNKRPGVSDVCVVFDSNLPGSTVLRKLITYHLIPDFHPYGTIRSYVSTRTYSYAHAYLEKFLFEANGMDVTPKYIGVITTRMLNASLDQARDRGALRSYEFLFFYIKLWISLSDHKLIPEEYRIDIPLRLIDTHDRQKDVQNKIKEDRIGWKPYSEEDLSSLVEFAFMWTEKCLPVMLDIREYLIQSGIVNYPHTSYSRAKRLYEFEEVMNKKVEGKIVCGIRYVLGKYKAKLANGKIVDYPSHKYWWKNKYALALDRIRDGLLILMALITGMRRSELCQITFDDIKQNNVGEWSVDITRYKTARDPNYNGEEDTIPLPQFIGETIADYKKLRELNTFMRKGYLFQPVAATHQVNVLERMLTKALKNISNALSLDGLHLHRFRKTIAEILINRSERNIELIRMLFGHKSYEMTLRYISRNPFLVDSIIETQITKYSDAFMDVVSAVKTGKYSGKVAERIADSIRSHSDIFKGKMIRLKIMEYITYLLESGYPMFIQRTAIGTYCIITGRYNKDELPPCKIKRTSNGSFLGPEPKNCELYCPNVLVLDEAKNTLKENIAFYSNIISTASGNIKWSILKELDKKIAANKLHLANLEKSAIGVNDLSNNYGVQ